MNYSYKNIWLYIKSNDEEVVCVWGARDRKDLHSLDWKVSKVTLEDIHFLVNFSENQRNKFFKNFTDPQ